MIARRLSAKKGLLNTVISGLIFAVAAERLWQRSAASRVWSSRRVQRAWAAPHSHQPSILGVLGSYMVSSVSMAKPAAVIESATGRVR